MAPSPPMAGGRGYQVRSALRFLRERRPDPYDREGDPDLLALVEEPYSGVEEARRRLQALLGAFEAREDRRAAFLAIYARMTAAVARRIEAGDFGDPTWVGEYLVSFANLYREAVYDYERGALETVADPWQLAFDSAAAADSLVVQDAALGVNAHINYDLALALDQVGVRSDGEPMYEDHTAVIDVIRDLVDPAQESLIARDADGLAVVDESLGRWDERFIVWLIDCCRDSAWRTAVAMNSRFRTRRAIARWINDVTSTGAAYLILGSRVSDRAHETLVDLESTGGESA